MPVRNGLLGLVAGLATTAAVAEPPVRPLVEGREPNPVARQFHEAEPPTFGYGGGPATAAVSGATLPGSAWWTTQRVWEMMLDRMTVPLGTAAMDVWD